MRVHGVKGMGEAEVVVSLVQEDIPGKVGLGGGPSYGGIVVAVSGSSSVRWCVGGLSGGACCLSWA